MNRIFGPASLGLADRVARLSLTFARSAPLATTFAAVVIGLLMLALRLSWRGPCRCGLRVPLCSVVVSHISHS